MNIDLFKGRLNLEAIYYSDKAGDQLTNLPLTTITGFSRFLVNSPAIIRSYGAEFYVSTRNIRNKDFSWTSRIIVAVTAPVPAAPVITGAVPQSGGQYTVSMTMVPDGCTQEAGNCHVSYVMYPSLPLMKSGTVSK